MPEQPGANDARVDRMLTNILIGYQNTSYLAPLLFPLVMVEDRSGIIPKFIQSDWFRNVAKRLSEREMPPAKGYNVNVTDTYYCWLYGIGHFISDDRSQNTQSPFDAYRDGARWLGDRLLMSEELDFALNFWKINVWGTDQVGTTDFVKWSTYATSTPLVDLRGFKRTVRRKIGGRDPNVLALGDLTYDALIDHPQVLNRVVYSGSNREPAKVSRAALASLLELSRVEVGTSMYTTDPQGTAESSVTYTSTYDDDGLLMYVTPTPALGVPTAGYKFGWRNAFGGTRYVKNRRDPLSDRGRLIEGFEYRDQHVTAANAGLFISDAVDEPIGPTP